MSQPVNTFDEFLEHIGHNPGAVDTKMLCINAYKFGYNAGKQDGIEEGKTKGIVEAFEAITKTFSKYIKH